MAFQPNAFQNNAFQMPSKTAGTPFGTGTNYRIHTYEPDGITALRWTTPDANPGVFSIIIPCKKVLRDTKINQYTCYIKAWVTSGVWPEAGNWYTVIKLFRVIDEVAPPYTAPPSRVVAIEVPGSVVVSSSPTNQTQWTLDAPIVLEGGSYFWAIQFTWSGIEAGDTFYADMYGVVDADTNIIYPKGAYPTFTNTLGTDYIYDLYLQSGTGGGYDWNNWTYISAEYQ